MIGFLIVVAVAYAIGRAHVSRRRRAAADEQRARAYERFVDAVLITLQSGRSVPESVRVAVESAFEHGTSESQSLVARLDKGESMHTVVSGLVDVFGPRCVPLVDMLLGSLSDGMPVVHVIERLSDEARSERRRRMNTDLRRLPIRLVFPLTFCVLPSFVLLTIVPTGFRALTAFNHGSTGARTSTHGNAPESDNRP